MCLYQAVEPVVVIDVGAVVDSRIIVFEYRLPGFGAEIPEPVIDIRAAHYDAVRIPGREFSNIYACRMSREGYVVHMYVPGSNPFLQVVREPFVPDVIVQREYDSAFCEYGVILV